MANGLTRKPSFVFLITLDAFVITYFGATILYQWAHSIMAWLLGHKATPFDITYGGWLLQHIDEKVNYEQLLATDHGAIAALVAVAGLLLSSVFVIGCLGFLQTKVVNKSAVLLAFLYWFMLINFIPVFQYLTLMAFSQQGDVGYFVRGLGISPWWVFIPGTLFVLVVIRRIFHTEIPRQYRQLPIQSIWGRRAFLAASLITLFLLMYTHGFNPLTDDKNWIFGKVLAGLSIIAVPVLFFFFDPSRLWVRHSAE